MSFSSMMESGRGPGVIGMVLAIVVVAGFVLLYFFVFDEGVQGGGRTITSVIAQQEQDRSSLKQEIKMRGDSLDKVPTLQVAAKELGRIKQENQFREGKIVSLNQGVADANEAIAAKTREIENYKDEYRAFVRGKAKGQVIEHLETLKGVVYENVNVKEVTVIGVQIRHDGGFKRIPYEELPAAMQEYYQFDPKQRDAAVAAENAARNQHDAAVTASDVATKARTDEKKEADAEAARKNRARALAMTESRISTLRMEIESLEMAIRAEERKALSRAPQMRLQLAGKQSDISALRAEATRLREGQ